MGSFAKGLNYNFVKREATAAQTVTQGTAILYPNRKLVFLGVWEIENIFLSLYVCLYVCLAILAYRPRAGGFCVHKRGPPILMLF